jgi:hypothetical protein
LSACAPLSAFFYRRLAVVIDAIRACVGNGPAPSDDERRAVRVVLKLHEK